MLAVILNTLLSNAIRYLKPPLKICAIYQSSPGDSYEHPGLRDNRIWIAKAQLYGLFNPPQDSEPADCPGRLEKNGVSLTRAKKNVQMHGGYISLDRVVNVGSTFIIHIPEIPP